MDGAKTGLTPEHSPLESFVEQIRDHAEGLGFGRIIMEFKIRAGKVTEAHMIERHVKLAPHRGPNDYITE